MKRMRRIAIITSTALRHRYFANRVSQAFEVCGIWAEEKAFDPGSKVSSDLAKLHFSRRNEAEKQYFSADNEFKQEDKVAVLAAGTVNDESVIARISSVDPELIILFGSSLIKNPYFTLFPRRIINMHLGLSPYYRGSGTNFWPLVDNRPECVGVTIHLAEADVDAGAILAHVRPQVQVQDGPHDIGCKAIIDGTRTCIRVLEKYDPATSRPVAQWRVEDEHLCRRKDLNDDAVRRMYDNFKNGMIAQYLQDKESRDKALRMVRLEDVLV